ncbi:hypothetical protein COT50_02745 [candidate division WWE3 bacterium CG08_land_8_20_14_0_20_41_10]|uniref:Regulatory protein RecX n=1 Tax=candidate division WWE3 bacterium CG08_land_8_20_14_0_20_41_10 TaxID=1975085 RepID=A0A2H0XBV6_UNCKA|nr:MAG: hypothetical protein COT50_02745 [candidate division WWE3 bacterium CG08_land_8_20_14_0_20_41_10]
MDQDELYQKMLTKVIMFLGYKPRTHKEIAVRLGKYLKSQKDLDDETKRNINEKIFSYLEENKLIDDEEFIKLFIESKTRGKSVLGKKVIQNRLMAKGISKEDATYFVDATVSEEDELNSAVKTLINKYKIITFGGPTPSGAIEAEKYNNKDTRDHMGRFLLSRGFSYSIAKQAVDYLVKQP